MFAISVDCFAVLRVLLDSLLAPSCFYAVFTVLRCWLLYAVKREQEREDANRITNEHENAERVSGTAKNMEKPMENVKKSNQAPYNHEKVTEIFGA